MEHLTLRAAVYAIFTEKHRILLLLRKNTGWMDGYWGLPAGHLEKNETLKGALVREVKEEVGLKLEESDLSFYHVMHRNEKNDDSEYMDFFFKVEFWHGNPVNSEPEKAGELKWFDLDSLPENIVPNVKSGIVFFRSKLLLSEFIIS